MTEEDTFRTLRRSPRPAVNIALLKWMNDTTDNRTMDVVLEEYGWAFHEWGHLRLSEPYVYEY